MTTKQKSTLYKLVLISMYVALMAVMDFTPLGYITTGLFSITLMTIPVALGAAGTGPVGGAVLGFFFGLTSFLQAFGVGFLIDPSAATLFTTDPVAYTITCFVPRIIAGTVSGIVFWLFERKGKLTIPVFAICAAIVPVLNTVLFMGFYATLYKNTVLGGASVMAIILSALTINFVVELIVTVVAGTAINKTVYFISKKLFKHV